MPLSCRPAVPLHVSHNAARLNMPPLCKMGLRPFSPLLVLPFLASSMASYCHRRRCTASTSSNAPPAPAGAGVRLNITQYNLTVSPSNIAPYGVLLLYSLPPVSPPQARHALFLPFAGKCTPFAITSPFLPLSAIFAPACAPAWPAKKDVSYFGLMCVLYPPALPADARPAPPAAAVVLDSLSHN